MKQILVLLMLIAVLCFNACSANKGPLEVSEPIVTKGPPEETVMPEAPEETDNSIIFDSDSLYTVITDRIGELSDVRIFYSYLEGDARREIEMSDSSLFIDELKSIPVTAEDLANKTSTGNPIWIEIDADHTKMISISGMGNGLLLGYNKDGEYIQTSVTCQVDADTDVF